MFKIFPQLKSWKEIKNQFQYLFMYFNYSLGYLQYLQFANN